ncbi:ferrous iron transport protein A [Nanchangia anserum]|uniref:Ferrous iron transport protein A n=1 Tax=Nanchangia anserum TaxID=2692125 RepID=A0A8I0G8D7_9ACTO|nr:FeoA family protein [Nanchangia anserum]MBD3689790.1 ferrous iron transport protein A [Nanchangia anserum]QOX81965.1 ferrous iron transport protein A [Nanchangia anserum]
MRLTEVTVGRTVRLKEFGCSPEHELRVKELGLREGAVFRVTHRAGFGGVVINLAGSRIAIDRGAGRHVVVEPMEMAS